MFGQIVQGFHLFFTFQTVLLILAGGTLGMVVGAIPGLTASLAIALLLPITFDLPLVPSLAFLMGLYKGGVYGGSITAILVRTPGTPEAAATVFDGYPLAQQGKAGKALRMALYASIFGDVFSDLVLMFSAGLLATIALKAGPVEYFSLLVLSLTIIGGAAGQSLVKGLVTAILGLFFAVIGMDPLQGTQRFVFGSMNMSAGVGFLPLLIGLFAVSEVMVMADDTFRGSKPQPSLPISPHRDDNRVTWADFKDCLGTIVRGSIIGTIIGALPGIGATAAAFISYGAAQRASKEPETFGKGNLRGVAAPESANNAVTGSTLIPLLTLGIPGSLVSAILIGAFLIEGLPIGPLIFKSHAPDIYGLYFSLMLADISGLFIAHLMIRMAMKVVGIAKDVLFPIMMVTCVVGSFAWNNSMFDVYIMLIFGILGYIMRKLRFPITPFLIAFILGPMTETSLREALEINKGNFMVFLTRPFSLICLILSLLSIYFVARRQLTGRGLYRKDFPKA